MRRAGHTHGVVTLAALDLRRRPDHRSELRSQLLMGETVRILEVSADGLWWRVRNDFDAYEGWVRRWGVIGAGARRVARWRALAGARVVDSFAEVRATPGGKTLVGPLFWNARVIPGPRRGQFRRVEFPDGRRGWLPARVLAIQPAGVALHERIRSLLGVPYLWGGRTPAGIDCSAFTQLVLAEQGIRLPRDADEQYRACAPLADGAQVRTGDLVFFGAPRRPVGHVGLVLGEGWFAHARGTVHIGSVIPGNPFHERELSDQFRGFGRPRERSQGGPGSCRMP